MNVTLATELLKALSELLAVLVWPTVFVFVLVRFGPALQEFFGSLSELTFKAAGVEAIAKRRQVEVAAALGAASVTQPGQDTGSAEQPSTAREIARVVTAAMKPGTLSRIEDAVVLWVDDTPSNNSFPRRSLEAMGIEFDLSGSTEDALAKTERRRYDLIISDMGRSPDPQAGYTLLETLRRRGNETPFIIYSAGGSLPQNRQMAAERGAYGSTDRAQELFELAVSALTSR